MAGARSGARKTSPRGARPPAHVLIVESSRAVASAVAARCNALDNIYAEVAADLSYAQELLKYDADRFVAAIVGLVLPDAPDGQIVDEVSQHNIPTVVLTGSHDMKTRDMMLAKGAADYVLKSGQAGVDYIVRMVERLADARNRRILVVDDSQSYSHGIERLLQQHGYLTATAVDGIDGLDCLERYDDISLVITDYNMPHMDGLAMVSEIRKTHGHDTLSIIAASDSDNPELLVQFLKTGATDYLRKSASVEELFCRIDQNIDVIRTLEKAREAAHVDYLTLLPNRRAFFETASTWHSKALETGDELLLAVLDIDNFKTINDEHGHDGGDHALISIAEVLETIAEEQDAFIARLGGEEFVCLWRVEALDDDESRLEDLRDRIAGIECAYNGSPVPITTSVGATRWLGPTIDDMVNAADTCLYDAKRSGRNCVRQNNAAVVTRVDA